MAAVAVHMDGGGDRWAEAVACGGDGGGLVVVYDGGSKAAVAEEAEEVEEQWCYISESMEAVAAVASSMDNSYCLREMWYEMYSH